MDKNKYKGLMARKLLENRHSDVEFAKHCDDEISGCVMEFIESSSAYGLELIHKDNTVPNLLIGCCTIGGADCEDDLEELSYWDEEDLVLSNVFIKEEFRGNGFGKKMIESVLLLDGNSEHNMFAYLLDSDLNMFYRKLGFMNAFNDGEIDDDYTIVKLKAL